MDSEPRLQPVRSKLEIVAALCLVPQLACQGGSAKQSTTAANSQAAEPRSDAELPQAEQSRRKAHLGEARIALSRLVHGSAQSENEPLGLCAWKPHGIEGPTPSLDVDCALGQRRSCWTSPTPTEPWEYSEEVWGSGAWARIPFDRIGPTAYHYTIEWKIDTIDGKEKCIVKATAEGDIDGDGIFSKLERQNVRFSTPDAGKKPLYYREIHPLE